jgi:hypothetical protein
MRSSQEVFYNVIHATHLFNSPLSFFFFAGPEAFPGVSNFDDDMDTLFLIEK